MADYSLEEDDVVTLDPTSGYLSGCLGCEQYTTGKIPENLTMPCYVILLQNRYIGILALF